MRDVVIKKALVTPDSDNGVEVLTNMTPSIHNETDTKFQGWDFTVTSIAKDGTQSDHVAGTIRLDTRPKGQKPKEISNLPRLASGKSWNQAFRDVGFDYGATSQDMDHIRSDGINYAATYKAVVKNERYYGWRIAISNPPGRNRRMHTARCYFRLCW
jgi:hypothetical protein